MELKSYSLQTYKAPIKIGIAFSILTLVLYKFGPYVYPTYGDEALFWFFIVMYNIAMLLGFYHGIAKPYAVHASRPFPIRYAMNILFGVALIFAIPIFLLFTGSTSEGLSINKILIGLNSVMTEAQDLYSSKQELKSVTGIWKYINYVVVLASPFHWAYMVLSMFIWKFLGTFKKIGTIFIWLLYLLQYITTGTNVGIFTFVAYFTAMYYIKKLVFDKRRGSLAKSLKKALPAVIAVFLLIWVFGTIMGSRIGDQYEHSRYNKHSVLVQITPTPFQPVLAYFTSYLAAPYQAMQMSIGEPFEPTFGVGHSFYLLDEVDRSRTGIWQNTYNMKINNKYFYDFYANWHTPYVWWANDVSFWGVPFILFLIMFYFGRQWRNFLQTNNLLSLLAIMLFVLFMMFISTNNQVFQTLTNLSSFWLIVIFNKWSRTYSWNLEDLGRYGKI